MRYIEQQLELAKSVTNGVIEGRTEIGGTDNHDHQYAVAFVDDVDTFIGKTSFNGKGAHFHYIRANVYDVVNGEHQIPDKDKIIVEITKADAPENIIDILEFYNLTEVVLLSGPSYPDDHTHAVVLRYAGGDIDKMGRKIKASLFTEGLRKAGGSMRNN